MLGKVRTWVYPGKIKYPGMHAYPTLRYVRYGSRYLTYLLGTLGTDLDALPKF